MTSNYDKFPFIERSIPADESREGWDDTSSMILAAAKGKKIVALECYPGVLDEEIIPELQKKLPGIYYYTKQYMLTDQQIRDMIYPDVTDDEIFGYITRLELKDFFHEAALRSLKDQLEETTDKTVYVYGPGATLLAPSADLIVYFDMPRWEGQLRFRRNEVSNLGVQNISTKASLQYKQAFFVDWRVCDKHKRTLMDRWDLVVDTTQKGHPKIVRGSILNDAFAIVAQRPFRVVPFFDPGPWGGQWMKEHCNLDPSEKNYAWCFDGVPEENSLFFKFNDIYFETPSINLVFAQAKALLGVPVEARFGAEFPIRFDFLDTIEGGNLSLQVHPTNEYIRTHFGMSYTQDESYYMLEALPDAVVYLGLEENIDPDQMIQELVDAQAGGAPFDAEKFVKKWPVKKHDHVLIPAGTVHCSGKNSMVLEISATPYIFTFKLWDWGRMGLDGKPRPINIARGREVINWSRTPDITRKELINTVYPVAEGDGWKEEYTGLHDTEFIETRRHWFTGTVPHQTNGSVQVLNLVEGREAIVESPDNLFPPFVVHYAETFIIPEAVKNFTIRPFGESIGKTCATLKAFIRFKA